MYKHNVNQLIMLYEFFLPFGGRLNPDEGSKANSIRLALRSLIYQGKTWTHR